MKSVINLFKSVKYYLQYRRRFESILGFNEFYNIETEKLALTSVRLLFTVGTILYSLVGILDYSLYPEKFALFVVLRIIFAMFTISSLILTFTAWGRRNSLSLMFISALAGELLVSIMISQLSGWTSLYFVGNILVTNAVTMFVPWRPRTNLLYCSLSLVGYVLIVGAYHPFAIEMLVPVTFMFVNGLNSYFASLGSEVNRMNQWASRLEVEKAHEDLKRLDQAKERFFSNISHELRTPLTLIIGPVGALAKRGGGWVSQELVAAMTANAQRLLRQVNAILDLGKIDSQEMKCNLEAGNVKELVFELYRASFPNAQERGIKLEVRASQEIPNSMFDLEKVETIVANLISNAMKFTPQGGTIILSAEVRDNGFLRLGVRDTGGGISSEQQEKIFERFHQVEDSAKKVSKGTGLGLSVAKEFAELHGGKIWVESQLGEGSQFYVEIPLVEVTADAVKPPDSRVANQTREDLRSTLLIDIVRPDDYQKVEDDIERENEKRIKERSNGRPVILYVDDSRDLRRYVDSILWTQYTVLLAQDGQQGFEQALIHEPDLILSDVMMPKMNGFELCRRVRHETKLKNIPFILLTANSSLDSRIEGLQEGADDYLGKPFSERELQARIKNLVSLRKQAQIIQKQMDAAKKIQQALLPPLTQHLAGVTIEAAYEASETLSGDYFNAIECGDWVYIYVADVSGQGLAASQVSFVIKDIFNRALIEDIELDALFEIVRQRYQERHLEYELGLQLMRVHVKTREVEYLRVNAPNPVVINVAGSVEEFETPQTQVVSLKLEAQSKFYCFSDGAYKFTADSGNEFGVSKLIKTLAESDRLIWPEGLVGNLRKENRQDFFPEDLTVLRISIDK